MALSMMSNVRHLPTRTFLKKHISNKCKILILAMRMRRSLLRSSAPFAINWLYITAIVLNDRVIVAPSTRTFIGSKATTCHIIKKRRAMMSKSKPMIKTCSLQRTSMLR